MLDGPILAAPSLLALINHVRGQQILSRAAVRWPPTMRAAIPISPTSRARRRAKRVLEIAAAGGHNLLMIGPPGLGQVDAGRAAARPAAAARRRRGARSLHGALAGRRDSATASSQLRRRFRDPHHSATLQALVGGGPRARPGEVSLAHHGVLFLDELPEFNRATLDALRQPMETGRVTVARANAHVTYPARFQMVAAMNPCRCGHLMDPAAPAAAPRAASIDYQGKLSGPLLDRIDLCIDVPRVEAADLALPPPAESSADVAARVAAARAVQRDRLAKLQSPRSRKSKRSPAPACCPTGRAAGRGRAATPTPTASPWPRSPSPTPKAARC